MKKNLSRLDVLDEMYHRGLLRSDSTEERDYFWLKAGRLGELKLKNLIFERNPNCHLIHDLTIDYEGLTQIDLLVFWKNFWWVVEVKNYAGIFECKNNQCILRGQALRSDPIAAMRNRLRIITSLAKSIDPNIIVSGAFINIHPNGELIIDSVENFDFLTCNQIDRTIWQHVKENSPLKIEEFNHLKKIIDSFRAKYPEILPIVTDENKEKIVKGLRCGNCKQYDWNVQWKNLICKNCSNKVQKIKATKELIEQVNILYHNKGEISYHFIHNFSNQLISMKTIGRCLHNYYSELLTAKRGYFINPYYTGVNPNYFEPHFEIL